MHANIEGHWLTHRDNLSSKDTFDAASSPQIQQIYSQKCFFNKIPHLLIIIISASLLHWFLNSGLITTLQWNPFLSICAPIPTIFPLPSQPFHQLFGNYYFTQVTNLSLHASLFPRALNPLTYWWKTYRITRSQTHSPLKRTQLSGIALSYLTRHTPSIWQDSTPASWSRTECALQWN